MPVVTAAFCTQKQSARSELFIAANVQVLLSICSLLTDPNPDDPLVPGASMVLCCYEAYLQGSCLPLT